MKSESLTRDEEKKSSIKIIIKIYYQKKTLPKKVIIKIRLTFYIPTHPIQWNYKSQTNALSNVA